MNNSDLLDRRTLLASVPALTMAPLLASAVPSILAAMTPRATAPSIPTGKPGEFNFLAGEWRIAHRMLKSADSTEWLEFNGEATCLTIMGGIGSVEDLRIPARNFHGMGLRLLDVKQKVWSDFWVNAASGVLSLPGTQGGFEKGVGTFLSEDNDNGSKVIYRGVWDEITGNSHRWRQGVSRDGGKTWKDTWIMQWRRP